MASTEYSERGGYERGHGDRGHDRGHDRGGAGNYSHLPYGKRPQAILDAKSPCPKITRQAVDFNSSIVRHVHTRALHRDPSDAPVLQPHSEYERDVPSVPFAAPHMPALAVSTRYTEYAKNKDPTVINCVRWTPQGRRVVLGCHSGELLLWNGFFFNFELRTQCHSSPVRAMEWSHSGSWIISSDEAGTVQYIEPSLNVVQSIALRPDAIRSLSLSPDDSKIAAACDDGVLSILDFGTCAVESALSPHGSDVKAVSWHPQEALILTAGKDKAVALVDPRSGTSVLTIHGAHRLPLTDVKWEPSHAGTGAGNTFATASRDGFAKVWDIRTLRPLSVLRGHRKDVNVVEWHPHAENVLASASNDGGIIYWCTKTGTPLAEIAGAHDMPIWDLNFHPMGHILASGSSDQTAKFWTHHLPGDPMHDKFNVGQTQAQGQSLGTHGNVPAGLPGTVPGLGQSHGHGHGGQNLGLNKPMDPMARKREPHAFPNPHGGAPATALSSASGLTVNAAGVAHSGAPIGAGPVIPAGTGSSGPGSMAQPRGPRPGFSAPASSAAPGPSGYHAHKANPPPTAPAGGFVKREPYGASRPWQNQGQGQGQQRYDSR